MSQYRDGAAPSPTPCPDGKGERWRRLLIPSATVGVSGRFLSECLTGYLLHYVCDRAAGFMRLCAGEGECSPVVHRLPLVWYGYAAVQAAPSGNVCLLAIPQAAYRSCPALQAREGRLRGWWFQARRLVRSPNGPVQIQLAPPKPDDLPPPLAFDVRAQVAHRYLGWKTIATDSDRGSII